MANDDEKNQLEELQETADLVESPCETEEKIVEINDEILDEGVISKTIKSSVPQPDGTIKTTVREISANDRFVRCFGCKRLFPRRRAGVYNKRYFCRECFPYGKFYFKKFFGFFTRKEEENARTEREGTMVDGVSKRNRPGYEPGSNKDGKEPIKAIQQYKGNAPGEISHA